MCRIRSILVVTALYISCYAVYIIGQDIAVVDRGCCQLQSGCPCCTKNTVNGVCPSCKPGYFGGLCKNICPVKCPTCTDHPNGSSNPLVYGTRGYCTNCTTGYFSTPDLYQCQTRCPDGCVTCVSFVSTPNNCDSCSAGFYLVIQSDTFGKCERCPIYCIECSSIHNCSVCSEGFFGPTCNFPCSRGCKDVKCFQDTGVCEYGCNPDWFINGGKCDVCVDGRYGTDCSNTCSDKCQGFCDKTTGYCSACKGNFAGDLCEQCKDGFYGETCNTKCPVNCNDNRCRKTTGFCDLCVENFAGDKCIGCVPGKYGYDCDQTCPVKCEGIICDRWSGKCDRCTGHFTGSKCDHCNDGYYLNDVTNTVTDASICNKCSKTCKTCQSLDKCYQCVTGYYGETCHQNCSVGCENNTCEENSGICTFNCSVGFNGSRCDECLQGKHGKNCSLPCPEHCIVCDRFTGDCVRCYGNFSGIHCEDCTVGIYGVNCNQTCSKHCNHSQCDRNTANCSFGCEELFTGSMCEECVEGKYGHKCNKPCPENCLENTCMIHTGNCYNCSGNFNGSKCDECINGFFGENCTDNCSTRCVGNHCEGLDQNRSLMCVSYHIQDDENEVDGGTVAAAVIVTLVLFAVMVTLAFVFRRRLMSGKLIHLIDKSLSRKRERIYENEPASEKNSKKSKCSGSKCKNSAEKNHSDILIRERTKCGTNSLVVKNHPTDELCVQNISDRVKKEKSTKRVHFENKHGNESKEENKPDSENKEENKAGSANKEDFIKEDPSYSNDVISSKVRVKDLAKYVARKSEKAFISEFQKLPKGLQKPCTEARKPDNIIKNRYNSVYPYDETRVVLKGPGSGYINACYINGYKNDQGYIASLGPTLKAMEKFVTFWRMVWQEKTEKIVMVTNLKEGGGMKCEKYWPDVGCSARYGDVSVTCLSEEIYAEYTVRLLSVTKEGIRRTVHHIHFTAWPDKGVPDDVTTLIEFRQKVKSIRTAENGRIIVHCSAGVGRTGTYIALDLLIQQGENEQTVDVFECVCNLRQQRTTMVQTWEQYQYLHQALVHSLIYGSEAISAEEFNEFLSSSSEFQMTAKFEQLQGIKETLSKDEKDAIYRHSCLQDVNRDGADIPGNKHRVYLYTGRLSRSSEYINATFLNSFKARDKYIVAQTPLPGTVGGFLTMILQENASCIVAMDPNLRSHLYLPSGDDVQMIAGFEVRSSVVISNRSFTQRKLCITMDTVDGTMTREVSHFQCNHWADDKLVPESSDLFLQLIKLTEQADDRNESRPIIVHCLNAAERSGLFCAVSVLLQKMDCVREVSVVNTLRQVKVRRPLAIPNKEQYRFCFTCISEHLRTNDNVYYNLA